MAGIERARNIRDDQHGEALTPAEIDDLRLVAARNANKPIADYLGVTEDTVKNRIRSILSKLDANDRTHAVMVALKRGIPHGIL